jgi:hypothetical protein
MTRLAAAPAPAPAPAPDSLGGMTFNLVLRVTTRYGVVFRKADDRLTYGSHQAFGHDGAGGSIGIADPWHGISYAWIPRRMSFPGGADARGLGLARIVRECAAGRPETSAR